MIKWMMVVVFMTPGGDPLMKSYHEYATEKLCLEDVDKALKFPHPYGLKVKITCERMSIEQVK